ncbi:MAG: copper resistance protein NlpE [Treponema sp.]|nr:copper resistance protein NlpE [Treponema sp.]
MKKNLLIFMVILAPGVLTICCRSTEVWEYIDIHNSQNSVSWGGIYSGIIPAASGPGIYVQINLYYNETFRLQYHYIDEEIGSNTSREGSFSWDETGNRIILDIDNYPPWYHVGSNTLTQLDLDGKPISGSLADNYILTKTVIFDL